MLNSFKHDQIIAKIQHFSNLLNQFENDKANLLITIATNCDYEKEKLKHQILLCQELAKEYYVIFEDILYR